MILDGARPQAAWHSRCRARRHAGLTTRTPTIQLPPLSSPQDGPPHRKSLAWKGWVSHVPCAPQEEETTRRITPDGGYQQELSPECLRTG